ncbi:MAG: hypothetical protein OSJ58_09010 [Dysosmobacter sp.]|uniref:hypothetical protein n=1 Tax=uncultured Oscillibacter sp. TaxID=876091 RepID=UPI00261D1ADE|nr:hypothetical protein [uncultured Oscillibacter sp.]MCX4371957.1 hypothetical protein [Dysosmobacter sp.]
MTVKQFYEVSEFDGSFCLDLGSGEEILISKEDKSLVEAFGNIVIDRVLLPLQPCRLCAKTTVVREVSA